MTPVIYPSFEESDEFITQRVVDNNDMIDPTDPEDIIIVTDMIRSDHPEWVGGEIYSYDDCDFIYHPDLGALYITYGDCTCPIIPDAYELGSDSDLFRWSHDDTLKDGYLFTPTDELLSRINTAINSEHKDDIYCMEIGGTEFMIDLQDNKTVTKENKWGVDPNAYYISIHSVSE